MARVRALAGFAVALAPLALVAQGSDDDFERLDAEPERCLSLQRIRDTDIVDDSTIIFELRGGLFYVNSLDRRCPNLARSGRISYEVRVPQLCSTDSIRVLQTFGAGLPQPGASCRLGLFIPVTEAGADFIRKASDRDEDDAYGVQTRSLPPQEAPSEEQPGEEASAEADSESESGQDD